MRPTSSRIRSGSLLLLGGGAAALAYVNWRVLQFDPGAAPTAAEMESPQLVTAAAVVDAPYQKRDLSDFDEVVKRPIFTASRRPFAPPAPEPAATREPERLPADLRLMGVLIDSDRKQALLRTKQHPAGHWVKEGQSVEGWLLRSVRTDGAVLAAGPRTHELRLYPGATKP